jgi:hypothetical protein
LARDYPSTGALDQLSIHIKDIAGGGKLPAWTGHKAPGGELSVRCGLDSVERGPLVSAKSRHQLTQLMFRISEDVNELVAVGVV